jgi:Gluconate 2-dehydrogenase subunit 3
MTEGFVSRGYRGRRLAPPHRARDQRQGAGQAGVGAKAFFDLLLAYTIAGFFSDPVHGGNRDMVGWKLIGFPGAQISYRDQILNYGQPFTGPFISLGQYQQQVSGGA